METDISTIPKHHHGDGDGDHTGAASPDDQEKMNSKQPHHPSPSPSSSSPPEQPSPTHKGNSISNRFTSSSTLHETITADTSTLPLAWLSLLTGLVDGAVYNHYQVWVGFQTGNIVQFSMNIAQFIYPWSPARYPLLTLMRALSFTSFFLASFLGARVGKWCNGEKKRWFLMMHALVQGVVLFAASGILFSRPNSEVPSWEYAPGVIVLVAFSMVSASIQGTKDEHRGSANAGRSCSLRFFSSCLTTRDSNQSKH